MSKLLTLSESLQQLATRRWSDLQQLADFAPQWADEQHDIQRVFALSDFIFEHCIKAPQVLNQLLTDVKANNPLPDYATLLRHKIAEVTNEVELHRCLRQFRHQHMMCIAWRDLLNLQNIETSLQQVSLLANQLIIQASDWLYAKLAERFGTPQGEFGPQPLLIIGMGKLGGAELNFSSDIDLIFTFPAQGETQGGRQSIEHQQFFTKLAQALIQALHQFTVEGQVFRVDMRLRPLGDSGPLVLHFDAFEDYYQEQGREWERYALLKGRILNSADPYTEILQGILKPFVYRRYLDFSAIESLRNMKALIQQEVRRRGLVNNIKLGQGGIREAEFIVQSLQLIRGGREPSLQVHSLLQAVAQLTELQVIPEKEAKQLLSSYLWLRKVEHCLQQFNDKQTQLLPDNEQDQSRLIAVLGYTTYADFLTSLQGYTDYIHSQFLLLIGEEKSDEVEAPSHELQAAIDLWQLQLDEAECQALLKPWLEAEQALKFKEILLEFNTRLSSSRIGQRGFNTLNSLMPLLIVNVLATPESNAVERLQRVLRVFNAILGRTAYLELLLANQGALKQLVSLCNASPWVTEQLARFPLLLDELINPATLYHPTELREYPSELRRALLRVEEQDLELQMETLRQFKLSQQLKIAAADIADALPIMKVSDHLTYLAEAIVGYVVDIAWQQIAEKHGEPTCTTAGPRSIVEKSFAVLGFGKLGGLELGYGSDLDLVFVHSCDGNQLSNGPKPIESSAFYFKLAQRIIHIFTTKTGLGLLYEVDMRLRPAGQSGLLVCHFNGFATYQHNEAWTWEHQALCRARFINGDKALQQNFMALRLEILSRQRDVNELRTQVVEMREKMRRHLAKGTTEHFDLKQDAGGIADIEFIVQFLTLTYCHQAHALATWTDNVRVLESLIDTGFIDPQAAVDLKTAYLMYRNHNHRLTLQNSGSALFNPELKKHQQNVKTIWQHIMQ
ncbi:bifunctional [glutamate--ammonia ligase]-adenylyl-L-tyrosine phosphorylase/[glutamate--ammonia-ligase] adenylyltransferase [Paraglaciecola hydrolytica]|uniref:Bifunctional glutamine synthetase adenylyltransferase/adenylyl-removing enzyme n=1 Tax=Paraglaciecola hydrolytica TaxID=1799789 RepID=A0A135ZZH5_9ALTE|nr:bifunctional [glutamate--ammonia ligase]-adenylyl-L-tyrosine phosphorylase/[glutamate--ammonia-ligase] adenylyltransferase [Paraglaciecola hydrolytica]KXI28374.1 bifunctional glutamine synthetase adenylyltransferase/deadenyltransferase [Paraglaciecola hydrolytica]